QRDRYRAGEVEQLAGLRQDLAGVAQVGVDVVGGACLVADEQRAGVREHDRVVVHVDDAAFRRDGLGDLVEVARRGDAGADVEELPDPGFPGQVADRTPEERPVRPRGEGHLRPELERLLGGFPVGGVVVLAAEQVVVHPGLVRHGDVERRRGWLAGGVGAVRCGCIAAAHLWSLRVEPAPTWAISGRGLRAVPAGPRGPHYFEIVDLGARGFSILGEGRPRRAACRPRAALRSAAYAPTWSAMRGGAGSASPAIVSEPSSASSAGAKRSGSSASSSSTGSPRWT